MNKGTVKIHQWIDGVLSVVVHVFDEVEEAIEFAIDHALHHDSHKIRVYDCNAECVHMCNPCAGGDDSYA
jgi:hypothetical protein